eukprot:TRINITY_DN15544_c0_g3_i1.p1 TRINITY_DN15544_c0_g3~~TRINITY_DN15544_c0_g3_i1.p1  ORF type:complete len:1056 (+),score=-131.43 TRINITY_DN15544_c0_g3_i1:578-3745(+)
MAQDVYEEGWLDSVGIWEFYSYDSDSLAKVDLDKPLGDKVAFEAAELTDKGLIAPQKEAEKCVLREQQTKRERKQEAERQFALLLKLTEKEGGIGIAINFLQCFNDVIDGPLGNRKSLDISSEQKTAMKELVVEGLGPAGAVVGFLSRLCQYLSEKQAGVSDFLREITKSSEQFSSIFYQAFESDEERSGFMQDAQEGKEKNKRLRLIEFLNSLLGKDRSQQQKRIQDAYYAFRFRESGFSIERLKDALKKVEPAGPAELSLTEKGIYARGTRLLKRYDKDTRFKRVGQEKGAILYEKRRLVGDTPWAAREGLKSEDYHYIQDKRGIFVKRYTYRFITPEERMLLSQSNTSSVLYPIKWDLPFSELEGSHLEKKYLVLEGDIEEADANQATLEHLGEFSLSRLGYGRFIATTQAGYKYDIRSNQRELFLRAGDSLFDHNGNQVQGGGVIKIDLAKVPRDSIRCQYKEAARRGMNEPVERFLQKEGVVRSGESKNTKVELQAAKKSAVRNRETHLASIPRDSIVGWKPFPIFSVWLPVDIIAPPIVQRRVLQACYEVTGSKEISLGYSPEYSYNFSAPDLPEGALFRRSEIMKAYTETMPSIPKKEQEIRSSLATAKKQRKNVAVQLAKVKSEETSEESKRLDGEIDELDAGIDELSAKIKRIEGVKRLLRVELDNYFTRLEQQKVVAFFYNYSIFSDARGYCNPPVLEKAIEGDSLHCTQLLRSVENCRQQPAVDFFRNMIKEIFKASRKIAEGFKEGRSEFGKLYRAINTACREVSEACDAIINQLSTVTQNVPKDDKKAPGKAGNKGGKSSANTSSVGNNNPGKLFKAIADACGKEKYFDDFYQAIEDIAQKHKEIPEVFLERMQSPVKQIQEQFAEVSRVATENARKSKGVMGEGMSVLKDRFTKQAECIKKQAEYIKKQASDILTETKNTIETFDKTAEASGEQEKDTLFKEFFYIAGWVYQEMGRISFSEKSAMKFCAILSNWSPQLALSEWVREQGGLSKESGGDRKISLEDSYRLSLAFWGDPGRSVDLSLAGHRVAEGFSRLGPSIT